MFEIISQWPLWTQLLISVPLLIGLGYIWRYRHMVIPGALALTLAVFAFIFRRKK